MRATGVRTGVEESLCRFRAIKDEFFASDPGSPLTRSQRARFSGLAYNPPDPMYAIEAEVRPHIKPGDVDLVTSNGDTERYRRAAVAWFEVDEIPVVLTLFRSDRGDLFVPFRDATSGIETYGAGRYLEAKRLRDGRALLDFNLAYNPYCAYNPGWRCPIPPAENHLAVPIRAGERSYRMWMIRACGRKTARVVQSGIGHAVRRPYLRELRRDLRRWHAVAGGWSSARFCGCDRTRPRGVFFGYRRRLPRPDVRRHGRCGVRGGRGTVGPIEDRGTSQASGGAVTLDASEFAFSPTCVEAGGGQTLEVTVTNIGSALHNLSVESLGIDEDVQAGETITVEVTIPDSGPLPFVCKYHVANGMQGAFLSG